VSAVVERPAPRPAPEGFHYEAVEQDDWTTDPAIVGDRACRMKQGKHAVCGKHAVAALNRGRWQGNKRGESFWHYCAEHLYGRWIEDGKVMGWRLVKDDA